MHIRPEEADTLQEHRLIVWPQPDSRKRAAGLWQLTQLPICVRKWVSDAAKQVGGGCLSDGAAGVSASITPLVRIWPDIGQAGNTQVICNDKMCQNRAKEHISWKYCFASSQTIPWKLEKSIFLFALVQWRKCEAVPPTTHPPHLCVNYIINLWHQPLFRHLDVVPPNTWTLQRRGCFIRKGDVNRRLNTLFTRKENERKLTFKTGMILVLSDVTIAMSLFTDAVRFIYLSQLNCSSIVYEADWLWCVWQIHFSRSVPFISTCVIELSVSSKAATKHYLEGQFIWRQLASSIAMDINKKTKENNKKTWCLFVPSAVTQTRVLVWQSQSFTDSQWNSNQKK